MSWLKLALGLIREAATTEMGREIIRDIRPGAPKQAPSAAADPAAGEWRNAVERRFTSAEKSIETLVEMHNAQDRTLVQMQKRQRIWNVAVLAIALAALILALVT